MNNISTVVSVSHILPRPKAHSLYRVPKSFLVVTAAVLLLPAAYAQLYTGSIAGTVMDSSGAVLAGAQIKATDAEKGFEFTATSDSGGRYVIRELPPAKYTVTATASGFKTQRKEGVTIDVSQHTAVDFSMTVGGISEVVDVTAGAVELQTQDAVTGQVVDRKFVNDLPLIGRGVLDLAYLTPGITDVDTDCSGCMANNFISNGSRNATADILLDGVSSTNFEQNSGILAPTYVPSVDAVQEFKVQQSNFSAEFGFTGATVVNVLTRSGTNQFHGTLYEFLRNEKLDANDWFSNQNGDPRAPLRRNDFGGTAGGPIWKNKTFFFFDYEGTRNRSFASSTAGVPTQLMRNGDFGEICTLNGNTFSPGGICSDPEGQLWDPYSATGVQGNVTRQTPIPFNNLAAYASPGNPALGSGPYQVTNPGTAGNLIDPVASKLMSMFPLPNQPIGSTDDLQNNDWFASGTNKDSQNQFDIKIDHRFSDSKLISGKYAERRDNSHSFNCFGNAADPCTGGPVVEHDHLFALNYAQTFSPTLVMNLSYGFTRGHVHEAGIQGDFPSISPSADLGLPSYIDVSHYPQYPAIRVSGYTGANDPENIGTQTFSIIKEGQETHQALGTVDWVRGKHDLKFGGEWRVHRINFTQPGWPAGQFRFDATGTSEFLDPGADTGGDGMASFLMGIGKMNSPQPGAGNMPYEVPNDVATQNHQFGMFVQDNMRVNPKFTLNVGVRYELSLPRTERFNRMNWLDPNIVSPLQVPGLPTLHGGEVFASSSHRYNYDTFHGAIQPRLGFAYQLSPSTVVRGGYGIYFSQPRSGAAGTGPWGYQGFDEQTQWIPSFNNKTVLPGARLSDPFPGTGPRLPPGSSLGAANDIGFDAVGPIPSISHNVPYEQAWSFGVQKELPWKIVVEGNYVGKKGTHLYLGGFRDSNRLPQSVLGLTTGTGGQIDALANTQDPNPFFGFITDPLSPLSQPFISAYQDPNNSFGISLPFPQFTAFAGDSPPIANSIYHAGQFRAEKSFSGGLEFLVTYAVSKSIDNASATDDSISWLGGGFNGDTIGVQNPYDLRAERSASTFDIPQVLQFSYVYSLPIGRGKRFGGSMHPVLNGVIGGWQLNGIWRFASGRPVILQLDSENPIPTFRQRPMLSGPLKVNHSSTQSMITSYFANACENSPCLDGGTSVVQQPDAFTFGTAPRTISNVRQPESKNVSMSLFKEFPLSRLREGSLLQFRLEAFNVFNHPNFGPADTDFGGGNFGAINFLAQSQREVQLGLKLYF
jgi:hypothetical protein